MPEHKGISCDLFVEQDKAAEYNIQHDGSACTAHIVSQENQLFGFKLNINTVALGGTSRLDLELWADGQHLDSFTFTETDYFINDAHIQDYTGRVKIMKLRFAKLNTTDEEAYDQGDDEKLQKLGTLEVKIWRSHQDVLQTACFGYQPNPMQNIVYENSIKGSSISHCTELSNPFMIANPSSWGYLTRKIDPYHTPWVTFVFRHASQAIMESEGIFNKGGSGKSTEEMVTKFGNLGLTVLSDGSDTESFSEIEPLDEETEFESLEKSKSEVADQSPSSLFSGLWNSGTD
ncbi:hypothetical protein TWF694_004725 [Orbilia ellipsospora]|uniref:DUF7918 domain-containing protein n=1 Tax=Orbilia ellipsospora TaxID=2528407 RepID=A0AAV9WWX7_9PEZI